MPGNTFAAWMDGGEMRDSDALFEQFWNGFKLPDYFGWSFPALNDCLRDLRWLAADQYTLLIEDAGKILSADVEARLDFFGVLLRAGEHWGRVKAVEGTERARFYIILECDEREFAGVRAVFDELM
ncbi:barstar family protein [Streptomyces sp. NPDC001739]|uniref:barstar family protein n=2 Tax=unclassified Streptomyces TaxID=2593676 RepID=UPI00369D1F3D